VHSLVEVLKLLSLECFLPVGELLFELLLVGASEQIVVSLDVSSKDVATMLLGVEGSLGLFSLNALSTLVLDDLSFLDVMTGETLLLVRDVETTIGSTLHGTEDTVSSGGADETNIEVSLEWLSVLDVVTNRVVRTINFLVALVHICKTLGSKESSSAEETSAVGSCVVGETTFEAVPLELERVSRGHDLVTLESSKNDLGNDTVVSAAYA